MDTILVTGGAGYIGSHTCKALARAGFTPVTFDNLSSGSRRAVQVQWGPLEIGDLGDASRLDEMMRQYRPVAVLHFAGAIVVSESVADPEKYYRINVACSLRLLEAMRRHGVNAIIFSSSAAVYGVPSQDMIREDHPLHPLHPYGKTKLIVEQMIGDFAAAYSMRFACLRYFNAAGADEDGEIGEMHEPETHAIPLALAAALGRRTSFSIFGKDYETPDRTAIRDYVHVSDLADAHVMALRHLLAGGANLTLNLGSGTSYSVGEIIHAIERLIGTPLPITDAPRRAGDPARLVADISRAEKELGWRPRMSDLDTIIKTALSWHQRSSSL